MSTRRTPEALIDELHEKLEPIGRFAVAVSGGIDSLTLATLVARHWPGRTELFHAVAPAVPGESTARLRALATANGWRLRLIDAQEFERAEYRSNPVDRCYFCKQSLYGAIARVATAQMLSGTNADDFAEYRPGLIAAQEHQVRHPFAELSIGKAQVRAIARLLGLGALSELPASPCLSSRIETGIAIDPAMLRCVETAERLVRDRLARERLTAATVRCRVRASSVVIELDRAALDALDAEARQALAQEIRVTAFDGAIGRTPVFAPYRNGSAFLVRAEQLQCTPASQP
ncbi:MAG TPA: hypothetical protein PKA20_06405 [Burkholderiaceae bacterium]|nr:hypothetical protein [Burkholderiaceae bacterium]